MTPRRPEKFAEPLTSSEEVWAMPAARRTIDPRKRRQVLDWLDELLEQRRLTPDRDAPTRS